MKVVMMSTTKPIIYIPTKLENPVREKEDSFQMKECKANKQKWET